jgi:hypothetical protein
MDAIHNGIIITDKLRFSTDAEIKEFIEETEINEYGSNLVVAEPHVASEQLPSQGPDK